MRTPDRTAMRWLNGIFFVAFIAAVTWPGYVPFNRVTPRLFGLPLSFAWPALWVAASFFVLALLDRSESRGDDEEGS